MEALKQLEWECFGNELPRNLANKKGKEIVKGTKSVLVSKNGYRHYTRAYFLRTKISTFKSPEITEYPLLKKDSSFLIPITQEKFKENEIIKSPKSTKNN